MGLKRPPTVANADTTSPPIRKRVSASLNALAALGVYSPSSPSVTGPGQFLKDGTRLHDGFESRGFVIGRRLYNGRSHARSLSTSKTLAILRDCRNRKKDIGAAAVIRYSHARYTIQSRCCHALAVLSSKTIWAGRLPRVYRFRVAIPGKNGRPSSTTNCGSPQKSRDGRYTGTSRKSCQYAIAHPGISPLRAMSHVGDLQLASNFRDGVSAAVFKICEKSCMGVISLSHEARGRSSVAR